MRTHIILQAVAIIACISAMATTNVRGSIVQFTISLDGAQSNAGAGSGSAATGAGTATLDTATNELTWSIRRQQRLGYTGTFSPGPG